MKINVIFTETEPLPAGYEGYWVHHRQQGKRTSVEIFIRSSLLPKKKVAVLVHELTEALATNLTDSRKFQKMHHDNANELETMVEKMLKMKVTKK